MAQSVEDRKKTSAKWYQAHKEHVMAKTAQWKLDNPDRAIELRHKAQRKYDKAVYAPIKAANAIKKAHRQALKVTTKTANKLDSISKYLCN